MTAALYRRYRPQTFADVIGQEHVTEPLRQALRSGRVGHAYLFSGPRGCGKTTSARILARCLNCEHGPTDQPCGQCPSCVALARGGPGSVDVIEIDAASHGGVEDARDLREKASYGPAQARFKVYIIDEAHMVTPQGFNALLKIVEEPPEHVKFVFATTEPEKVIGTIRSRTHHYPFRLVPPTRLTEYLEELCRAEGVGVAPGVLPFVVRAGGGSVRDSLSVLDQLMAGSGPEGLTYAGAAALLGFTPEELLDATVEALAAGDGAAVFRQIDRVVETGQDPRRFVEDLLERFRDLIVISALGADAPGGASAILRGVPEGQLGRMRQQASSFGPGQLSHAADTINAGLTEMTGATSPRLHLELVCARLLLPAAAGERGYAARLDRVERRLELAGPGPGGGQPGLADRARSHDPGPAPALAPAPSASPAEPVREPAPERVRDRAPEPQAAAADPRPPASRPVGALDTEALRRSWPDVLAKIFTIRRVTWTFLSEHAQVLEYDGRRLVLGIATVGLASTFRQGLHAEVVRQALIDTLGLDVRVEGIPHAPGDAYAGGEQAATSSPQPTAAPAHETHEAHERHEAHEVRERHAAHAPTAGDVQATRAHDAQVQPPAPPTVPPATPAATASPAAQAREQARSSRSRARSAGGASPARRAGTRHAAADTGGAAARAEDDPGDPGAPPPPPDPLEAQGQPPQDSRPAGAAADADVSVDDEDIQGLDQVGMPVIASVLGGTIIEDRAE
ncbi:MAG: DNA polymerase III subunit gamma and tau [Austwickia sp.]|nr:DNA polymerase III subunit gamma and tau [Austwickia sp.]MBK8437747.1 DNA polymerase III subunit gamma and tau [Austwickia sp.]MBK9100055.1 DNA polymerase III subunit gamma and tau [Austwickia sp.]